MKTPLLLLSVLALVLVACGKKEPTSGDKSTNATNTATSANPITAPVDYLGAVAQAQKYANKAIDTAQVTQAIQQFQAAEDRFPKDLNELVKSGYLVSLPKLPTGMVYEYNAANGQVKVVRTP